MNEQDYSQRAIVELRRRYDTLIEVYDQVPLEKLNIHLPEPMKYVSKNEFVYHRMIGISAATDFAVRLGLLSAESARTLLSDYETRRPDIFKASFGDM